MLHPHSNHFDNLLIVVDAAFSATKTAYIQIHLIHSFGLKCYKMIYVHMSIRVTWFQSNNRQYMYCTQGLCNTNNNTGYMTQQML